MKQKSLHCLFLIVVMGAGLAGCRSDVKLDSITVDSKLNAKLSLPIGEVKTSFGNLIGLFNNVTDSTHKFVINDNGIVELIINEHREREFHKIDLTEYIGTIDQNATFPSGTGTLRKGVERDFPFDLSVSFKGINDDLSDERLDSLVIDTARFTIRIYPNNINMSHNDIKKVTMVLGDQFHRAAGTRINVPFSDFGKDLPVEVDNFTLVMMKDPTQDPSNTNALNTAGIQIILTLDTGEDVAVYDNSGFHFTFEVEMLSYRALFGYFKPGAEMRDSDKIEVPLKFPGDEPVVMPVKEPTINLTFTYGLSMPLQVYIHYLKAMHSDGTETYASFDGNRTTTKQLNNILPIGAPFDADVQSNIPLSNDTVDGGHIDRFFQKEIADLGYKYDLLINQERASGSGMKQFRLTNNTKVALDFRFEMPFEFNEGLNVAYVDTARGINLSMASLDSLAAMSQGIITSIDSADLNLYLVITNEIPVDLDLDITFLDSIGQKLDLPQLEGIRIEGATISGSNTTASKSVPTVSVQTKDFDTLAQTRAMRVRIHIGDDVKPSTFYADKFLSIKAGVTGDVQAVMNMQLGNNNNN